MPRPGGALNRSLQALTIGVVKGVQAREKALSRTTLSDMVQHAAARHRGLHREGPLQLHLPVSFPIPYVYAPMQHDSDLERPHFNYGVELGQAPTTPLSAATPTDHPIILCQLAGWITTTNGFTTGANVVVTSWIPGAKPRNGSSRLPPI
jgi:predicted acylesterase/phospholipase RssA